MPGRIHKYIPCSAVLLVFGILVSARPYKDLELKRHKIIDHGYNFKTAMYNKPREKGNPPVSGLNNRNKFLPKATIITFSRTQDVSLAGVWASLPPSLRGVALLIEIVFFFLIYWFLI